MEWLYITMPLSGIDVFWPGLVILGLGVGVIGGFFGMGGAWMVTPGLNILGFPMTFAIGTGVMQVAGISVAGTTRHAKLGNVDAKMGATMAVTTMIGLRLGAAVVMWLDRIGLVETSVRILYVVLLTFIALLVFSDIRKARSKGPNGEAADNAGIEWYKALHRISLPPMVHFKVAGVRCSLWLPAGVGFMIGIMAGLLGIGGGLIALPALIYLVGCSAHVAVGTSLFTIMISGMYGAYTYARFGRAELLAAIIMLTGASFGVHVGVTATKYVKGTGIKYAFVGGVIGCVVSVILKQLASKFPGYRTFFDTCSLALVLGLVFGLCVYITVCMVLGLKSRSTEKGSAAREG